jgi:hypothetical protein
MCGEHTREQIINWVMSKDAVASCFIKDVLSMSESGRGGGDALVNFVLPSTHPCERQVFPTTFSVVSLAGLFPSLPS